MTYLLGIVAALVVLALLVRFPIPTFAGLLIIMVGIGVFITANNMRGDSTLPRDTSPISAADLEMIELSLERADSTWELVGTVVNNSAYTLTRLGLLVEIESCPPDGDCTANGQDMVRIYRNIEPGARGEISELVDFRRAPIADDWTWTYSIVELRGQ